MQSRWIGRDNCAKRVGVTPLMVHLPISRSGMSGMQAVARLCGEGSSDSESGLGCIGVDVAQLDDRAVVVQRIARAEF